jgi:uncharacterized membrane protein
MLDTLPLITCLGAGLVGGVFFAFSAFVMKAIAGLPAPQGIAAMQRINAVVVNPLFMSVFIGTAVFAGLCIFAGFYPWGTRRSLLLVVAGASYLVGAFGVTAAFNVPRNERLARLDAESADAAAYWPKYVRGWLRWNHVRAVAAAVAAGCAAWALAS